MAGRFPFPTKMKPKKGAPDEEIVQSGEGISIDPETGERTLNVEIDGDTPQADAPAMGQRTDSPEEAVGIPEEGVDAAPTPPELPPEDDSLLGRAKDWATRPTAQEKIIDIGNRAPGAPLARSSVVGEIDKAINSDEVLPPGRRDDHGINLDYLDSPEEQVRLMDYVSTSTNHADYKIKGFGETIAKSRLISDRDMIRRLVGRKAGDILNDEEITKARQVIVASAEHIWGWSQKLADQAKSAEPPSDIDLIDYQRAVNLHYALQRSMQGSARDAARALNSMKIPVSPLNSVSMETMLSEGGGREGILAKANAVAQARDVFEANDMSVQSAFQRWLNAAMYQRTMGLLSGPTTHAKNIVGNSLVNILSIPERALTGFISQKTIIGSRQVFSDEASSMIYAEVSSILDSLKLAGKAFARDHSAFGARKIQENSNPISSSQLGLDPEGYFGKFMDYYGGIISLPGRALTGEDEFFKGQSFSMEMRALANRVASKEGLEGEAKSVRINELLDGPSQEKIIKTLQQEGVQGDDLDISFAVELDNAERQFYDLYKQSIDFANYSTFTNTIRSPLMKDIGGVLKTAGPVAKFIVPFYNTLANILEFAGERNVLTAHMLDSVKADLMAGGARRDAAIAKQVMGTGLSIWGLTMVLDNKLTGAGPDDYRQQTAMKAAGWKPYQIQLPFSDIHVSYAGLEPVATPLAIIGDVGDALRYQTDDQTIADLVGHLMSSTAKSLGDKTMLVGFSEFLEALESDQSWQTYASNQLATFTPYSGLGRSTIKGIEGGQRSRITNADNIGDETVNRIQSMTPFWNKSLPLGVDLYGEDVLPKDVVGDPFYSPFYKSVYKPDPKNDALIDNSVPFPFVGKTISFDGMTLNVTSLEHPKGGNWVLRDLRQLIGRSRARMLNKAIKSSAYKNAPYGVPDPNRGSYGSVTAGEDPQATKGDILAKAISIGTAEGKQSFLKKYQNEIKTLATQRGGLGTSLPDIPGIVVGGRKKIQEEQEEQRTRLRTKP
jgi:hypothetical protein